MKDPVLTDWLTRPGGLVERLRELRARAGLRGADLAEPLGWYQSKVSKIENATQMPTEADVRGWAEQCGAPEEAEALVAMLAEVPALRMEFVRRSTTGDADAQAEHDQMAREATVVRFFETAIIPGLLQIPAYARAVMAAAYEFSGYDMATLSEAVAERLKRQHVVYEATALGKQFEFLIAESALRWQIAPAPVMRAQLDRLLSAMGLDGVRIGIVPLGRPGTLPMNGFVMYDDLVVVETFNDESYFPGGAAAKIHLGILDRLWSTAAEGDDARRLIMRAADALAD